MFQAQVAAAQQFDPVLINSHSGADYFTEQQAHAFFDQALQVEKQAGIRPCAGLALMSCHVM